MRNLGEKLHTYVKENRRKRGYNNSECPVRCEDVCAHG